ncbi:MAG: hypothetical protein OXU79_12740 [Gemmatimonadota bacterium]|nr:hypothetical protein [Gemmatimonadota bacterium]
MPLTDVEFASILEDDTKRIVDDIVWTEDEDHSPALEFRVNVTSESGWPLFVKGRFNSAARTLNYALILTTEGRIYGLDLGKDHHNPQCDQVGEKHKHTWSERYSDKEAYVLDDIDAHLLDPVSVWTEFCVEAGIQHDGKMNVPPAIQGELW